MCFNQSRGDSASVGSGIDSMPSLVPGPIEGVNLSDSEISVGSGQDTSSIAYLQDYGQ